MDKEARFFERIVRTHYWLKQAEFVEQIVAGNRVFYSKYERIDAPLDSGIIDAHRKAKLIAAHSLIDDAGNVPHIAIDYNGTEPERFYHHSGQVLARLGYDDLVTFRSKSPGHLHLYIVCGDAALQEAIEMGKIISQKLEEKLAKRWRVYPTDNLPDAYNILNLPYEVFTLSRPQGAMQ